MNESAGDIEVKPEPNHSSPYTHALEGVVVKIEPENQSPHFTDTLLDVKREPLSDNGSPLFSDIAGEVKTEPLSDNGSPLFSDIVRAVKTEPLSDDESPLFTHFDDVKTEMSTETHNQIGNMMKSTPSTLPTPHPPGKWKGPSCCALNCTNRQKKRSADDSERNTDITFHLFPSNFEIREEWVAAMRRRDFVPSHTSKICSRHFKESDFRASKLRRRLKDTAVPSIFNFPEDLQPSPNTQIQKPQPQETKNIYTSSLFQDHTYALSSRKILQFKIAKLNKVLKTIRERLRRGLTKNRRLKDVITQLRNKNLIESEAEALLQESFSGMSCYLFRLLRYNSKGKESVYLPKVKNFALTLHFLSPRAYNFVRPILLLPHPLFLRQWKSSVYCSPGYLSNMLKVASTRARETGSNLCSLLINVMNLRRDVSWVPSQNRYCGFIDFGNGPVGNSVATNALVFMLISLKGRWKAPIAYFLTVHISSLQLAHYVKEAIIKAADYDLVVKTLVADGLRVNMKAASSLGCNINIDSLCTHFPHPHPKHKQEKIYFICDPPHMLKRFRNFFAERGVIKRKTMNEVKTISWNFIQHLHDTQTNDPLYLVTKLSNNRVGFCCMKKKVGTSGQTLSSSVATAIDHLRDDLKLDQFQDSEETCYLIRQLDTLSDLLNTKNPFANGTKAALSLRNMTTWKPFLEDIQRYLLSLYEPTGIPIYKGKRAQCVLGFIITAQSTINLATELLSKRGYKYLLTYKFSQHHLELFFDKIRQLTDWNNNPTSEQFRIALKILLTSCAIGPSKNGNAVQLDDTVELAFSDSISTQQSISDFEEDPEFLTAIFQLDSALTGNTDLRQSCILYTAGHVARRLEKLLKCHQCSEALFVFHNTSPNDVLHGKAESSFKIPSKGVFEIVSASENAFRICVPGSATMHILLCQKYIDLHIQTMVLSKLQQKHKSLFPSLIDHFYEHEIGIEADHITQLIKVISSTYIRMRLLKAGKKFYEKNILMGRMSKRMKLNKMVLFSGQ